MLKKNLISILDITTDQQLCLFDLADKEKLLFKEYNHFLEGKVLGSLFLQPSTRTRFSFQSAFVRLGGQYIGCSDINEIRSGPPYYEPIEDLGRIISNYCDIVVMRTVDDNQTGQLLKGIQVPLISAGSGNVTHPTQALTDFYTIRKLFGTLENHNILIVGTPRQRTINSFLSGMAAWGKNDFHILCQDGIEISPNITANLGESRITYYHSWSQLYDAGISHFIDVIYIDKIFYETHWHDCYIPKKEDFISHFSKDTAILHPLPRTAELPYFIDDLPGAHFFLQAQYGLYVRAALFLQYFL